jgi:hypothetical protein
MGFPWQLRLTKQVPPPLLHNSWFGEHNVWQERRGAFCIKHKAFLKLNVHSNSCSSLYTPKQTPKVTFMLLVLWRGQDVSIFNKHCRLPMPTSDLKIHYEVQVSKGYSIRYFRQFQSVALLMFTGTCCCLSAFHISLLDSHVTVSCVLD